MVDYKVGQFSNLPGNGWLNSSKVSWRFSARCYSQHPVGLFLKIFFVKIFLGCFVIFDKLSEKYANEIESKIKKSHFSWNSRVGKIIKYGCAIMAVGSIVGLLLYDIFGGEKVKTENLIGLAGLFAYILISCFLFDYQ